MGGGAPTPTIIIRVEEAKETEARLVWFGTLERQKRWHRDCEHKSQFVCQICVAYRQKSWQTAQIFKYCGRCYKSEHNCILQFILKIKVWKSVAEKVKLYIYIKQLGGCFQFSHDAFFTTMLEFLFSTMPSSSDVGPIISGSRAYETIYNRIREVLIGWANKIMTRFITSGWRRYEEKKYCPRFPITLWLSHRFIVAWLSLWVFPRSSRSWLIT